MTSSNTAFNTDFSKLQKDAEALENSIIPNLQNVQKELAAIQAEIEAPIPAGATESELNARMALIEQYLNLSGEEQEAKSEVLNAQQTVRADFENCVNDISANTTNTAADGSGGGENLTNTALDLDSLLSSLNGTNANTVAAEGIQQSVGGATSSAFESLDSIRKEIYLGNGDAFDPTITSSTQGIFAPTGVTVPGAGPNTVVYRSFEDAWQAAQSTSGNSTANGMLKPISDSLSQVDQTYSSASSECNVETQNIYSGLQTIESVMSGMYKSITAIEQNVNQKMSG